jgi:tetratricopeptide (TPR) repeat protein
MKPTLQARGRKHVLSLAFVCFLSLACPLDFLRAETTTNTPPVATESGSEVYNRGLQLFRTGNLEEAYRCFQIVATNPPSSPLLFYPYFAEWFQGEIQEQWNHAEAATEHYLNALEKVKARETGTNDAWLAQLHLQALSHLGEVYDQQGRMGLLYSTLEQRDEVLKRFQDGLGRQPDFEKDPSWWGEYWYLKVDRATMLRRLARLDESDASMKEVVEETTRLGRLDGARLPIRTSDYGQGVAIGNQQSALDWLSEVALLREQMDDAVRYRERERALVTSDPDFVGSPVGASRYVYTLVRRDGASQRAWDLMNAAVKLQSRKPFEWWFQTNLAKCELLAADGQAGASLELLNQLIEGGRQNNSQRMLPLALKQRAQLRLDMGDVPGANTDAKESLGLYRAMGWKRLEPDLYEIHAQCLGRQGRYAEAVQTWQDAYQMCETLKLHHRSLHMLLGMAALELRMGNQAALKQIWARIDSFVAAHPDLPQPTQLRLRLARLDYLKAAGTKDSLLAAYQETKTFTQDSRLTPYQLRSWAAYQLDATFAAASVATQSLPMVDLQPVITTTRVATGELAHARFALVNPSTLEATGTVRLSSTGLVGDWAPTDQGWKIVLRPQTNATDMTKSLSIAPGTATALFLEAAPASLETTSLVTVAWLGSTNLEARWEFGASTTAREVAVVNASLSEDNPFYSVTFYHELYYRGQTSTLQNLRMTSSQPCRIEIADASTGQLLAIDATGDGKFDGSGDVLAVDADGDGYPDFNLGPDHDVAPLELLAYPSAGTNSASRDVEITLWHREASGWVADAVDVLRMR